MLFPWWHAVKNLIWFPTKIPLKSFENPVNLPWINSQDFHGFLVYSERRWNWLGQFTNNSLRATTATRGLQKGIPEKIVIERVGHRYVRSLQKYQRLDTSSQIEISKKFNCCEVVSLPEWVTSERVSIKREVEVDEEKVKDCSKFLKGSWNVWYF